MPVQALDLTKREVIDTINMGSMDRVHLGVFRASLDLVIVQRYVLTDDFVLMPQDKAQRGSRACR